MKKITFTHSIQLEQHTILPCYEDDINDQFFLKHTGFSKINDFKADSGEVYSLLHQKSGKKIVLAGLGKKLKNEHIYTVIRKAAINVQNIGGTTQIIGSHLDDHAFEQLVYASRISMYQINKFKEDQNGKSRSFHLIIVGKDVKQKSIYDKAIIMADSTMNVMDLVNLPPNVVTPYYLADYCVKSGKSNGFKVKVVKGDAVKRSNFHALYEVGKGSKNPPAFITMEYIPSSKKAKKIGLIGKGISFDTGGISIKNSNNLHYMKCDMAGAATVIGMMEVIAKLKLPFHVMGIVPAAENAIGSNAYRPGDVISSYSGKSIEIIDTDAEGRLVLADGLSYMVDHFKPDTMVDLATLTGSCVATLGYFAAGLFTTNEMLASSLYESGLKSGEKVWRLPMWDEYKAYMNSDLADIKNLSSVPVAGATTAAKFLEFFTENHKEWAHIDVAGVSFTDSDIYKSRTASGYGIRLLTHWLGQMAGEKK